MFQLLGVKPDEIQRLISQLQAYLEAMKSDTECMKSSLEAIERTLSYEYGRASHKVVGYDPLNLPVVAQVTSNGQPTQVEVAALLGKYATRGHIVNIGNAMAALWFKHGTKQVGPYYLPTGAALEISWALEVLEVQEAGQGPVNVQILMQ
jgi:hypothetical protein